MYSRSKLLPLPGMHKSELLSTEEISDILRLGVDEAREILKAHQTESGKNSMFYYVFTGPKSPGVPGGGWIMSDHGMLWFEMSYEDLVNELRDVDGK
jgi:hypothetical protein